MSSASTSFVAPPWLVAWCGWRRPFHVTDVGPEVACPSRIDRSASEPSINSSSVRLRPAARAIENKPHPEPADQNDRKRGPEIFGIRLMALAAP